MEALKRENTQQPRWNVICNLAGLLRGSKILRTAMKIGRLSVALSLLKREGISKEELLAMEDPDFSVFSSNGGESWGMPVPSRRGKYKPAKEKIQEATRDLFMEFRKMQDEFFNQPGKAANMVSSETSATTSEPP